MATTHLSDEQLRALVAYCTDGANKTNYFSAAHLCELAGIHPGSFSHWRRGKRHTPSMFRRARDYCNDHFAVHELPAQFAATGGDDLQPPAAEADNPPAEPPAAQAAQPDDNDEPDVAEASDEQAAELPENTASQRVRLCSWNLKNLGSATDDQRKAHIYNIMNHFDVIAVQEIRTDLRRHIAGPQHAQMSRFRFVQGELHGAGTRRERLALFYRHDQFDVVRDSELDTGGAIERKPLLVTLRARQSDTLFSVLTVHIKYGGARDLEPRRAEVAALIDALEPLVADEARHGEIYLCGDFNLDPSDRCFAPLRRRLHYVMTNPAAVTTIGQPGNNYDTFWVPVGTRHVNFALSAVVSFQGIVDRTDAQSRADFRKQVSDHVPVTAKLDIGYAAQ